MRSRNVLKLCALFALVASPAQAAPLVNLYQSIGVNIHSWYPANQWPQRLVELGVKNARGKVATNRTFVTQLQPFFQNGGKIDATIVDSTGTTIDKVQAKKNLDFLKSNVGPSRVGSIEGANEFNHNGGSNWAATLRDFTQWTHDTVRADPAWNGTALIAPSIWKRQLDAYKALGDISAYVDRGCIHYYNGGRRPTQAGGGGTLLGELNKAKILTPAKPLWMTENGWQAPFGSAPISYRAQAKYALRSYLDNFGYGVEKLFNYQLMDNSSDGYGLLDASGNPKLAFTALKNFVSLIKDDYASSGQIGYTISGAPASLKTLQFSKSDGSFLILLWLDVDSYDLKARRDIESAVPVTVNLSSAHSVEVYDPTFSTAMIGSTTGSSVDIFAKDQVTVLKIR